MNRFSPADHLVYAHFVGLQNLGHPTDAASVAASTKLPLETVEGRLASLRRRGFLKEE